MARNLEDGDQFNQFLLGETKDTLKKVLQKAKGKKEKLRITGYSPPMKEKFNEEDNQVIFKKIIEEKADIVWVSLGGGKQEKWIYDNSWMLERGYDWCGSCIQVLHFHGQPIQEEIYRLKKTGRLNRLWLRKVLQLVPVRPS